MRDHSWVLYLLGAIVCAFLLWLLSHSVYDDCIKEGGTETECENRLYILFG